MTDILLPPWVYPQDEQVTLMDGATIVFRPQTALGIPQRVQFMEPRLQVKRSYKTLTQQQRAAMFRALVTAQGAYRTVRAQVGYNNRGSFPDAELLNNNMFTNGTIGWTAAGGTTPNFTVTDYVARLTRTAANSQSQISQVFATTTSAAYVGRAVFAVGNENSQQYYASLAGGVPSSIGYGAGTVTMAAVATATSMSLALVNPTQCSSGQWFEVLFATAERCAIVNSGGNTGNAMGVGCLPTSTAGLLLAGDMVEINGELKFVNAALNSDGLGNGWLQFNPALFRTPNSGDPVIVGTPMGKFIINGNPSWTNQYGVYADLELTMDAINE